MKKQPIQPYIYYKRDVNDDWYKDACFSFLGHKETGNLYVRFENNLDKAETIISTQEWFDVVKELGMLDWVEEYSIEEDYYYVTVPLSGKTKNQLLFLLTLLRYPGEYFNICWNYKKISILCPNLHPLDKLYLSHQIQFSSYPLRGFYFNQGHSVFPITGKLECELNYNFKNNKTASIVYAIALKERSYGSIIKMTDEEFKEKFYE